MNDEERRKFQRIKEACIRNRVEGVGWLCDRIESQEAEILDLFEDNARLRAVNAELRGACERAESVMSYGLHTPEQQATLNQLRAALARAGEGA